MSRKSKIKVPKRVAGVKIPKVVRKGPVLDFVNSSAGRMLIAEALTAAVGLFAYKKTDESGGLERGAGDLEDSLKQNTARLTFAFGEGVRAFREALAQPEGVGEEDGDATEAAPGSVGLAKKNSRRPAAESSRAA
jgi:hypothetical protein